MWTQLKHRFIHDIMLIVLFVRVTNIPPGPSFFYFPLHACCKFLPLTHQPVFPKAIDTELSSRLHLDSLIIASQFAPGETTTNSRTPYLRRKASRNRKQEEEEEKEMLRKRTNINPSSSYRICNLKLGPIVIQIIQVHRSDMVEVRSWLWACMEQAY